jgi:hypothetical protein
LHALPLQRSDILNLLFVYLQQALPLQRIVLPELLL